MLDEKMWEKVGAFHGHTCPGLAIGFKACEGAIDLLGLDASKLPAIDEEVVCISENDACGVDAVQALLGCTIGKSNLILRLRGKMAFSFFSRTSGKAVRLCLKNDLNEGMERIEYQEFLLTHSYDELFSVSEPSYGLPENARIFASQPCSVCGESTGEYALRIQNGKPVCLDCYNAYEREGF